MDIYINIHSNQEIYFLEEMIHDIVYWLQDDTSCLINKKNYITTRPKTVITNKGWSVIDEGTSKTSDYYMFIFYLTFFFEMLISDVVQREITSDCFASPSFQMTDRATVHFYYKNPFNFLYQKEIES